MAAFLARVMPQAITSHARNFAAGGSVSSSSTNRRVLRRKTDFRAKLKSFWASGFGMSLKWSLMVVILVWFLVYSLSESSQKLPEFVYVNF